MCPGFAGSGHTRVQRYLWNVRTSFAVRSATSADFAGIAQVATDTDQAGEGAGADARYVDHLLTRGRLVVATTGDVVVGYAATVRIADVDMLADLFLSPEWQGQGMGGASLDRVWSDAPERMTLSSTHPSALPLYVRYGMAPILPMLYVSGEPFAYADGLSVEIVSAADAAHTEIRSAVSIASDDYRYWADRPRARCFVLRRAGAVVGLGR